MKKKEKHCTTFHKSSTKDDIPSKIPELGISNKLIERNRFTNFLHFILNECILWKDHIRTVKNKIAKNIRLLHQTKHLLSRSSLKPNLVVCWGKGNFIHHVGLVFL